MTPMERALRPVSTRSSRPHPIEKMVGYDPGHNRPAMTPLVGDGHGNWFRINLAAADAGLGEPVATPSFIARLTRAAEFLRTSGYAEVSWAGNNVVLVAAELAAILDHAAMTLGAAAELAPHAPVVQVYADLVDRVEEAMPR